MTVSSSWRTEHVEVLLAGGVSSLALRTSVSQPVTTRGPGLSLSHRCTLRRSGPPFNSCSRRVVSARPEPTTSSLTVDETRTSLGSICDVRGSGAGIAGGCFLRPCVGIGAVVADGDEVEGFLKRRPALRGRVRSFRRRAERLGKCGSDAPELELKPSRDARRSAKLIFG